jgi:hypothetical protein
MGSKISQTIFPLAIGNDVYWDSGNLTSCVKLGDGFYITNWAIGQVTQVSGGKIVNITLCPSQPPTPTQTQTMTLTQSNAGCNTEACSGAQGFVEWGAVNAQFSGGYGRFTSSFMTNQYFCPDSYITYQSVECVNGYPKYTGQAKISPGGVPISPIDNGNGTYSVIASIDFLNTNSTLAPGIVPPPGLPMISCVSPQVAGGPSCTPTAQQTPPPSPSMTQTQTPSKQPQPTPSNSGVLPVLPTTQQSLSSSVLWGIGGDSTKSYNGNTLVLQSQPGGWCGSGGNAQDRIGSNTSFLNPDGTTSGFTIGRDYIFEIEINTTTAPVPAENFTVYNHSTTYASYGASNNGMFVTINSTGIKKITLIINYKLGRYH